MIRVHVASRFGITPGAERVSDGPMSGEAFAVQVLIPAVRSAIQTKQQVELALDGVMGYPHTFIRGAVYRLRAENLASQVELQRIITIATAHHQAARDNFYRYLMHG